MVLMNFLEGTINILNNFEIGPQNADQLKKYVLQK